MPRWLPSWSPKSRLQASISFEASDTYCVPVRLSTARKHWSHGFARFDAAGETPLLVEDSERLCPGPGVRWRFVSEVEDREQGQAVVERLKQRPEYWNFDYPREELDRTERRCNITAS